MTSLNYLGWRQSLYYMCFAGKIWFFYRFLVFGGEQDSDASVIRWLYLTPTLKYRTKAIARM